MRDSINNGISVKQGDYIGIAQSAVKATDSDLVTCALKLLASIEGIEDRSIITVFYGEDADEASRQAFAAKIAEAYPLMDFIEIDGQQTIYPFILALE